MITTAIDAAEAAGITYRQLDYWTRAGYISPELAITGNDASSPLTPEQIAELPERSRDPEQPGSGATRYYSAETLDVLKNAATLTRAGMHVGQAFEIARQWAEHPLWPIHLGGGITIRVDAWHPQHPCTPEAIAAAPLAHADQAREALTAQLLAVFDTHADLLGAVTRSDQLASPVE